MVGRELGYLVPGADNLASWFCAAAAFLAMAHTFQQGEMVQVGLLVERLSEAKRKWFEGGALCIALAFSVYVSHSATMYARVSFLTNELPQSGTLALPLWIPQSTFALGSALLALALLGGNTIAVAAAPTRQATAQIVNASGKFPLSPSQPPRIGKMMPPPLKLSLRRRLIS